MFPPLPRDRTHTDLDAQSHDFSRRVRFTIRRSHMPNPRATTYTGCWEESPLVSWRGAQVSQVKTVTPWKLNSTNELPSPPRLLHPVQAAGDGERTHRGARSMSLRFSASFYRCPEKDLIPWGHCLSRLLCVASPRELVLVRAVSHLRFRRQPRAPSCPRGHGSVFCV